MQDYYHRVDWAWEGDWIFGETWIVDDWNGGWYDFDATFDLVGYGGGCTEFYDY